jgi:hypothetical protein
MRTYIFVSIFSGEEIPIIAPSIDEAWKKLEDAGFRRENYMLDGA